MRPLLRQQFFYAGPDFLMGQHFTSPDLRRPFFHFTDKPLIVFHQTLYRLLHQGIRVAALDCRKPGKLSLQAGVNIYFHAPKGRGITGACQVADTANKFSLQIDRYHFMIQNRIDSKLDYPVHFLNPRRPPAHQ